jgi:hypothetical protein
MFNSPDPRPLLVILLIVTSTIALTHQTQQNSNGLFTPSQMSEVKLKAVRVRLGRPVQITESHGYAYIPTISKFPNGELLATYSLVPDTNENPAYMSGFQISKDGGKTWGHRYEVLPEHQRMIYVPEKDGSLMAIPTRFYPITPGDRHNFHACYIRFEPGGRRVIIEPGGVRVVNWPWAVEVVPRLVPQKNSYIRLSLGGNAIRINGRLIATAYARKEQEPLPRSILLASEDDGRTWHYFSTIADSSIMPIPPPNRWGWGPSETAMIQLADGDLMAVFRVGNGKEWNLRRAYSSDGGRTWSRADPIPPYSVDPSMVRINNGTIVLSTGRPGIRLWLSTDPRGKTWQDIDVVEHHNRWAPNETYRISPYPFESPRGMNTWSYTKLVEVAPNRLLLVYDRIPPDPQIGAYDSASRDNAAERLSWAPRLDSPERFRVFVLPIEVERD